MTTPRREMRSRVFTRKMVANGKGETVMASPFNEPLA
jgi:hypothetical protein